MNTEDRVNEYYKWVLGRIKEELETTSTSKPLRYELSHVAAAGVPNNETEANIIGKLEELKAIKIIKEIPRTWEYSHRGIFELKVLQPKFDEIYQKYDKLNNPESSEPDTKLVKVTTKRDHSERSWQLLGNLSRQHDSFANSPEREFFLGIADYIKFIVETPELDEIAKLIKTQEAEDEKKISKLEELVKEETEKTAKELEELMVKEHFEGMKLAVEFQSYYGIKEGRIQSSATLEEALWGQVTGILRAIDSSGHRNLLDKYIKTSPDIEGILEYTFSEHYNEYEEELKRFRELRKTTVWGSWDSLVLVYLAVHKFKEEEAKLDPVKDVWKRMNFIGIHGEMQEILNGSQRQRIQFVQDEYKTHLNRVHIFFTNKLEKDLPVLQVVEDARLEAIRTLSAFQFPVIQLPDSLLKGMTEVSKQTNALVKSYQSMASLADTVMAVQKSLPDFSGALKGLESTAKMIEQLKESQNLLASGPVIPSKFVDFDYEKRAEEAEIRRLQLIKLRKDLELDDANSDIEKWLKGKDERTVGRIGRVVRALNYEWELRDEDSFKIPHDKFGMFKITSTNDLEAILTNLHNKKFIFVSRKVAEQPPSDDPLNKPGGMQLWQPLPEDPGMLQRSDTQVEISPVRFKQLVLVFKNWNTQKEGFSNVSEDPEVTEEVEVTRNTDGWELLDDGEKVYLKKDGLVLFTFPTNWSRQFKYFKYLWDHPDQKVDYKSAYEYATGLTYPNQKGVIWKTNKSVRNEVNKLRKLLEPLKLPIKIETARGLTLTVSK